MNAVAIFVADKVREKMPFRADLKVLPFGASYFAAVLEQQLQ